MKNPSSIQSESRAEPVSVWLLPTLYEVIETVASTICVVLLVFTFLFKITIVDGSSMNQTLHDGDVLITSSVAFEPEYGDIVVFSLPNGDGTSKKYVKRVIATEGQTVYIDFESRTVTVDGKILDESDYAYFAGDLAILSDFDYPVTVPDGCVFVMGDNRNNSLDSRYEKIGFLDKNAIFGKVIARIYPLEGIGLLTYGQDTNYGD